MKYTEYSLFDAHLHIIDPRNPLVENNGYLLKPFDCKAYLNKLKDIRLLGGAVISDSFRDMINHNEMIGSLKVIEIRI